MARQTQELSDKVTITASTQAERVSLAIVAAEARGERVNYDAVASRMEANGVPLARSTWNKLRNADYLVRRYELLTALAEALGVAPAFFLEEAQPTPEDVEAQRDMLEQLKREKVLNFAARTYENKLSADDYSRLQAVLDDITASA